jgi:serine-type D-Ala-D-Ala carboxypeptidase/endopeptidase
MLRETRRIAAIAVMTAAFVLPARAQAPAPETPAGLQRIAPQLDRIFTQFMADNHVPGLVYGIVAHGHLEYVKPFGVQDMDAKRPVTPDSLFRIASMTKAFTALTLLHLRDQGKVALQANAEDYIPEMRGWHYPTTDSPKIRVIDILGHTPGFVTDDPWGDRQTPIPESEFTAMLQKGIAFDHAPETAFSYSNLGFAMVGRVIQNVEQRPYSAVASDLLLKPLGMTSSGFNIANSPPERRAIGYRYENGAFAREPDLGEGAFTSIGGLQTSANDYSKWVAYLLSAWPPRSDPDNGPVPRQTMRELAKGSDFPLGVTRPGDKRPNPCRQAETYGMALYVVNDCDLPWAITHNGGYPGYGSVGRGAAVEGGRIVEHAHSCRQCRPGQGVCRGRSILSRRCDHPGGADGGGEFLPGSHSGELEAGAGTAENPGRRLRNRRAPHRAGRTDRHIRMVLPARQNSRTASAGAAQ